MPKKVFGIIALGVIVVAGVAFLFFLRPRGTKQPGQNLSARISKQVAREEDIPALPDISLEINSTDELAAYQGTPLIFSVTLANQRAMNAALENEANEIIGQEVREAVAKGALPQTNIDPLMLKTQEKQKIRIVQLGDESTGWEQFIRFEVRHLDGTQTPVTWPLRLVTAPKEKTVILDQENTFQLDYALGPESAVQIQTGDYQIMAVIDVPTDAKLGADRWRGRVESEPAKLKIIDKPPQLSKEEEEKLDLDFAHYYLTTEDFKAGLDHAQKALAINPQFLPALIQVGEAKEGQGDLEGALEAYQKAISAFYQQNPNSYDAPEYLLYKTTSLMEKLGLIEKPKKGTETENQK